MKNWLIGIVIALVSIGIGVGGAYAFSKVYPVQSTTQQNNLQGRGGIWNYQFQFAKPSSPNGRTNRMGPGFMFPANPQSQNEFGGGMMGGQSVPAQPQTTATRLTIDQVVTNVETYLNGQSNLKVAEVMEFSNNNYVAVTESDSGRGAMELLVNPYTGLVSPEIGPNMMWNLKYGAMRMMGTKSASDNTVTLDEAKTRAQSTLSAKITGATLNDGGFSFYGYYTFDYSVNGKISGMLSVNGLTGQVMFHTWHGQFIDEKEF
jgi:hypothetical protein